MPRAASLILATVLIASCDRPGPSPAAAEENPEASVAEAAPLPMEITLPAEVTFNEHIQPILSENCYHCHGPDAGTRLPEDAPLRLDLAEPAFAPRQDGLPVILKGDSAGSLLVKLLRSEDPEARMPPPESHKELKPRQIALIERWIDQGAEYQDHWSFLPVVRPAVPDAGGNWGHNEIDPFVVEKLAAAGLTPNPPEEPARFYRRLHFDLTGLPPAPDEAEAFTWDRLDAEIDRLLATPASAEHLAVNWLDAARYADTHGIHIDNYRAIWPYRDWVVRAFAGNMPWDRFTIEQIAGDLLPDPTLDQLVATGFHRCLPTTGEGGAIDEEYDAIYAQDRTNTTAGVWLGLTMGCAACHDHKFDPITMKDTYSFNAFFRNTPMSALDGNNGEHPPNVFVPLPEDREGFDLVNRQIDEIGTALKSRRDQARPDFENWLASASLEPQPEIDFTLELHLPLTETGGPLRGRVNGGDREWPASPNRVAAPVGAAPLVSESPVDLGDLASFSRSERVSYGGFIRIEGSPSGAVIARMDPAASFRGWDIWLQDGRPGSHVIDSWDKAANKIVAGAPLPPGTWHHVMVTFDGTQAGHQASAIYVDGKLAAAELYPNTVGGSIETPVPLRLGSRHGDDSRLSGGSVALQDFRFYRRLLSPSEIEGLARHGLLHGILATPAGTRTPEQTELLFNYYISSIDPASRELVARLDARNAELTALRARGSVSLIMRDKTDSLPSARILRRGVYSDPGEEVGAATPAFLPPLPADAPPNRLGLARWLISRDNPLTARVTMNRLWRSLFGTGLVETAGDFGVMGARPSHPKLLDFLASEFMESGWDHRHMIKLIVSSATYRQSEQVTPEKLEADPFNQLLSRGPRHRLAAEELRDMALAASGLLSTKVGGPPVKPYQPEGIWEAVAMPQSNTRNYTADQGESLYRRSLYTIWKRTAPHPAMEILNAPTREEFCVGRERTNTPLQAFVTLNDPQFVEASRHLAGHALRHDPEFDARLDFITRRLLARVLSADERPFVRATLDQAAASFAADPESAVALITTGESAPDPDLPAPELAAWTLVASQILNLDETLTK